MSGQCFQVVVLMCSIQSYNSRPVFSYQNGASILMWVSASISGLGKSGVCCSTGLKKAIFSWFGSKSLNNVGTVEAYKHAKRVSYM